MISTISASANSVYTRGAKASAVETPDSKSIVNRIIDKTYLGANYTASALSGSAAGLGSYLTHAGGCMARSVASVYPNLHRAEIIGPNITGIGYLVAAPAIVAAALVGLPVSLINGLVQGAEEVDPSQPRQFSVAQAAQTGYQGTSQAWDDCDERVKQVFDGIGNQKLAPGEKPFDIPLLKVGKTLAVATAAAAIGGLAGVAGAAAMFGRESAAGIGEAFSRDGMNLSARLSAPAGAVLGAAASGVSYGAMTSLYTVVTGISQTWQKDSLLAGVGRVLTDTKNTLAVAIAPERSLLSERQN